MDNFYIGQDYFYIAFSKGQHELRMAVEDEEAPDEVIVSGHYTWVIQVAEQIQKNALEAALT
ncbi:hypothetical protein [Paenibacillus sp. FSL R5-0908]|uniref:hypothetical protein n=1 Tax=Paenibacillus sp. FSL R5-0908 TaxID=2921664 RepID=UPI0030F91C67